MLTIDTHCHVGLDWFEPAEVLLYQMDRNQVDKAVLIQTNRSLDNAYLVETARRYPGRFAVVGAVAIGQPDAPAALERWAREGMQGIRLSLIDHPAIGDPAPVLEEAQALGMVVSCIGLPQHYASEEFRHIVQAYPRLRFMIEHMGYVTYKDAPPYDAYRKALALAKFSNAYMKIPGLGEFMPRPSPMTHPPFDLAKAPPFIDMAFEAFGAERLTIGTDSPPNSHREGYANVVRYLREYLARRTAAEQEAIFGGTAQRLFRF